MIDTGGEQRAWKAGRSPACFENWLKVADVLQLRSSASIPQQIRNSNIDCSENRQRSTQDGTWKVPVIAWTAPELHRSFESGIPFHSTTSGTITTDSAISSAGISAFLNVYYSMGIRRQSREAALQFLFQDDFPQGTIEGMRISRSDSDSSATFFRSAKRVVLMLLNCSNKPWSIRIGSMI